MKQGTEGREILPLSPKLFPANEFGLLPPQHKFRLWWYRGLHRRIFVLMLKQALGPSLGKKI